jgi:hypothetical protein
MTGDQAERLTRVLFGIIGWALTCYGAYLLGGWGPCFIAIGVPLMINNWDVRR